MIVHAERIQVVVYVESCGSSPVHSSSNLTSESDYRTAIGQVSILRHHKLSDLELLVQETLKQYWSALKLFGNSRSIEDNGDLTTHNQEELDAVSFREFEGCTSLHERIMKAYSLSNMFTHHEEGSNMNSNLKKKTYLEWNKAFLKHCRTSMTTMDLTEDSILSYQMGSICWKPGEIPMNAKLKTIFSMFGELEKQHGRMSRGAPEEGDRSMEVTVSLKGKHNILCACVQTTA